MSWNTTQIGSGSLVLHCGANNIERNALIDLPVPEPMGRFHNPTPHHLFLEMVEEQLDKSGLTVTEEAFGATPDGNRFFGLLQLDHTKADYTTLLGLRSSHDETMAKGIALGSRVFICDNTAMSSNQVLKTRNTKNVLKRLPAMIATAVGNLPEEIERQDRFFEQLRAIDVSGQLAESIMVEMVRREIVNPSNIGRVIRVWDAEQAGVTDDYEPRYLVDGEAKAWTLFNAATEIWSPKQYENPLERPSRTPAMMERTLGLTELFEDAVLA
jgi:hypothetical protein